MLPTYHTENDQAYPLVPFTFSRVINNLAGKLVRFQLAFLDEASRGLLFAPLDVAGTKVLAPKTTFSINLFRFLRHLHVRFIGAFLHCVFLLSLSLLWHVFHFSIVFWIPMQAWSNFMRLFLSLIYKLSRYIKLLT